jgi:dTDP-4-dehydrorhamnose reductase
MASIFAVVLTYNRKDLLRRSLDCILAQSRRCDRVIVIDNCSADGTAEMLRRDWADQVEVHTLSRNVGASGGFNAAIRIAHQAGADFTWVMDDDVLPEKDALSKLIEADQFLADNGIQRAFVLSSAWDEEGRPTNVPKIDTRPARSGYENWPRLLHRKMLPVTRATFVSILLPRSVVAQYGLPLAPMFIWGEDSDYTLRITEKCPGFLVADSKVLHLRQVSGAVSIFTEVNPVRVQYHRHHIRNHMYIARIHSAKLDYMRHAVRQIQTLVSLLKMREFEKARIVAQGIWESFWFRPKIESADAPVEQLGAKVVSHSPVVSGAPIGHSAGSMT